MAMRQARVAYQGQRGSYSEEAALKLWGDQAMLIPCTDFSAVVNSIIQGYAEQGLLPISNSIIGPIVKVQEILNKASRSGAELDYTDTVNLPIRHALLGVPGTRVSSIKSVWSQREAIEQCNSFISSYPGMEVGYWRDTAGAAHYVSEQQQTTQAAIASERNALIYNLEVLAKDIQDTTDNTTTFIAISLVRSAV